MRKYLILLLIFIIPAANAGSFDVLNTALVAAKDDVTAGITTTAILWLSSFALVQMTVTNIGLFKSGADIEAIFGKLIGSLMWFGFCFYVLKNGPDFIGNVSKGFFDTAATLAGAGGFDPGLIITHGAEIAANLVAQINKSSHMSSLFLPALLGGIMGVVILATAALIAFKIFLIKIETMLIVMMAPLSFSFMGLNALKDQGIAPFKSLVSLIYRVLIMAILLKTMSVMSDNLVSVIASINSDSIDGIWSVVFAGVTGYVLLAFLVVKSDSLASNLASGTTSMGTGDVASAAAMGAAVGAAVASGGASVAGAAASGGGKAAQSMGDVMKNMMGGGSVSNAGGSGTGGKSSSLPTSPPSSSLGAGSSAGGPAAPAFETNSHGAPMNPDPNASIATPADNANSSSSSPSSNAPSSGSGANIGGDVQQPKPQQTKGEANSGGNKKGFWDYAKDANQHFAQEKTGTSVSISTHHAD